MYTRYFPQSNPFSPISEGEREVSDTPRADALVKELAAWSYANPNAGASYIGQRLLEELRAMERELAVALGSAPLCCAACGHDYPGHWEGCEYYRGPPPSQSGERT